METIDLEAVQCPLCQRRPVETTAKSAAIRGFLIAYQVSNRTLIGCVPCVRGELFKEAGRSMLLGWFSISAIIANPFFILYNSIRGLTVRPNPEAVIKRLAEMGFEPRRGAPDVLQAGYSLAAAMVAADGKIEPREIDVADNLGRRLFESFDPARFRETCEGYRNLPPSHDLARMMRDVLNDEQKEALFSYMVAIAQADGSVGTEETSELNAIAAGLDLERWRSKRAS